MGCGSSSPAPAHSAAAAPKNVVAKKKSGPKLMHQHVVIFEVAGGSDKGPDGYRKDTMPIVKALVKRGWTAEVIFYTHEQKDAIFKKVKETADAFVHRINPGNLKDEGKYFDMLRELIKAGVVGLPHPDAMLKYGAKDALSKLNGTKYGMDDTQAYYTIESFKESFPKMLAKGERVLKQNRGSTGEGIWRVQTLTPFSGTEVPLDAKIKCTEAKDNHVEEHTLEAFMKFCEQYIVGENGQLIDQRFLPRIKEGEIRVLMINRTPINVVHKKPADGADAFSATLFSGAKYRYDPPEMWKDLVDEFLAELPTINSRLGGFPSMPLIWTGDFILADKKADGKDTYVLGEINCSCIGFTSQLELAETMANEIIAMTTEQKVLKKKVVIFEVEGGSDKGPDGYRKDTLPIVEALKRKVVWDAEVIFYTHEKKDAIFKHVKETADAYVHRINPGNLKDEGKYFDMLRDLMKAGVVGLPDPDAMLKYGAKDALSKLNGTKYGMDDTQAYYTIESFKEKFPKMLAKGERVLKQNRGSTGEGIWRVQTLTPFSGTEVPLDAKIKCTEAKDNHVEEHTLEAFMKFCEQYIVGENGQLIDQRFLPRIKEGEIRVLMLNRTPINVVHKKPADGADAFSATLFSGAKYRYDPPEQWTELLEPFLAELDNIDARLGPFDSKPLIWTADFILGEKDKAGKDTYVLGEINCSCIGFTSQLELADPMATTIRDMVVDVKANREYVAPIKFSAPKEEAPPPPKPAAPAAAPVAAAPAAAAPAPSAPAPAAPAPAAPAEPVAVPAEASSGDAVLLPQPAEPLGKIVVIECRGGSDKGADGHRKDTIPICNEIIKKGWAAEPVFYSDEEHDAVYEMVSKCQGYIGRVNPGKYDGVTQSKLDDMMRKLGAQGVKAMASPDTMIKMGAKDALQKIRDLSCGMVDTYAYYDIATFKENFPKTVATGTRVIKQNRGSQGEGIWVCNIKPGQEGEVTDATLLELQEAVDNHKEEKTIADFMTFCEQYIVGENGQLIDQRFLPRIVEGEIRVNMIYDTPTELVHKKPADGGISATLKSGATYVSYKPEDPQFATLMDKFIKQDLPKILPALGLDDSPLPLIWTTDFILGDKDADGNDTYFVGEFNCSCVGITQQLYLAEKVAAAAISICRGLPRPVVICGPSGVGKGTLIEKLKKDFPTKFGFSVSHTTRAPRPGEVDGTHYHFVTHEAIEADIAAGKFVESNHVHGNVYGTSSAAVAAVSATGRIPILDIDVQGAANVKASPLNAMYVFVSPPSFEDLEKRLRGRATESEEAIVKRLAGAQAEMDKSKEPGFFDHVIINDDLERAYEALRAFIFYGAKK